MILLMDGRPGAAEWVFFTSGRGGSWRYWDDVVIGWVGRSTGNLVLAILAGAGIGAVVLGSGVLGWRAVGRVWRARRRGGKGKGVRFHEDGRDGDEEERPFLEGDDETELIPMR
jgi:hypothetical protein